MHNNTVSNTKSNREDSLLRRQFRKRPEVIQELFLRWFHVLARDSKWRAYMRSMIKENELPVIEFAPKNKRHRAK